MTQAAKSLLQKKHTSVDSRFIESTESPRGSSFTAFLLIYNFLTEWKKPFPLKSSFYLLPYNIFKFDKDIDHYYKLIAINLWNISNPRTFHFFIYYTHFSDFYATVMLGF